MESLSSDRSAQEQPTKMLVVRGTDDPDDLGLEQIDLLVTIPRAGQVKEHKRGYEVAYVDLDPADCVLADCLQRVKEAFEDAHPGTDKGHSAAGMWMFYWVSPGLLPMAALARSGQLEELRDAAEDYIESGFGARRGPTLAMEAA